MGEDKDILNAEIHASTTNGRMHMGCISRKIDAPFVHFLHMPIVELELALPHLFGQLQLEHFGSVSLEIREVAHHSNYIIDDWKHYEQFGIRQDNLRVISLRSILHKVSDVQLLFQCLPWECYPKGLPHFTPGPISPQHYVVCLWLTRIRELDHNIVWLVLDDPFELDPSPDTDASLDDFLFKEVFGAVLGVNFEKRKVSLFFQTIAQIVFNQVLAPSTHFELSHLDPKIKDLFLSLRSGQNVQGARVY